MNKLLLKKGRDYRGHGVFAKRGEPFEVDDNKKDELLETGYFTLVSTGSAEPSQQTATQQNVLPPVTQNSEEGEQPPATQGETDKPDLTVTYIKSLKKEELIALAKEHSINIDDCKNNLERTQRITGALGLVDFTQLGLE